MSDDISQVTMPDTRNLASARSASTSFLIALSVILVCLSQLALLVGVLGKAFYVQRDEFTAKSLKDAKTAPSYNKP